MGRRGWLSAAEGDGTLASGVRGGCEEQGLPLGPTGHLVEGKESWRWSNSKRYLPLLCLVSFFGLSPNLSTVQLRPTYAVLAKLV